AGQKDRRSGTRWTRLSAGRDRGRWAGGHVQQDEERTDRTCGTIEISTHTPSQGACRGQRRENRPESAAACSGVHGWCRKTGLWIQCFVSRPACTRGRDLLTAFDQLLRSQEPCSRVR